MRGGKTHVKIVRKIFGGNIAYYYGSYCKCLCV